MNELTSGTPASPAPFGFDQIDFVTSDHHFGHARIIELAERPFPSIGESHRQQTRELLDQYGWEVLPENLIGRRGEYLLLASHYPYRGDSHNEERHGEARPIDTGLPLIHGHTHARDHGPHGSMCSHRNRMVLSELRAQRRSAAPVRRC